MMNTIRKVAYCGVAMLQEEEVEGTNEETSSVATGVAIFYFFDNFLFFDNFQFGLAIFLTIYFEIQLQ